VSNSVILSCIIITPGFHIGFGTKKGDSKHEHAKKENTVPYGYRTENEHLEDIQINIHN